MYSSLFWNLPWNPSWAHPLGKYCTSSPRVLKFYVGPATCCLVGSFKGHLPFSLFLLSPSCNYTRNADSLKRNTYVCPLDIWLLKQWILRTYVMLRTRGQLKLVCSSERVCTFVIIFQIPSQERPHWNNGGPGMGKTVPWLGLLGYAHLLLL